MFSCRSAIVFSKSFHYNRTKWFFGKGILKCSQQSATFGHRTICTTWHAQKKKSANPEAEVIVNKTSARNVNKKNAPDRTSKQKTKVWGVIDVYRFITVETLAALMNKSIGKFTSNKENQIK